MDYFDYFPALLLPFFALFPRTTVFIGAILGEIAFGGFLWWIGLLFFPHVLVAVLAIPFYDANPGLVTIAWIVAVIGTMGEAKVSTK